MKDSKDYKNFNRKENLKLSSKVVHGGDGVDPATGSLSFPIYQTATFKHSAIEIRDPYNYSRCINPTREELEKTMAILEEGTRAFAVNSGMAATTLVFSLLKPGDHIIMSDDIYGGTFREVSEVLVVNGVEYDSIDLSDLDCEKINCIEVESVLDYLDNPQKLIQEYTKEIFEKRRNILFLQYENYKLYSKKFDEIINDESNVINKKKVIKEALKDKKTVNVTILKNGHELTFKTSTRSFIHNWSCGYSLYDLPAQDRKKYKELFRYEDYTFTEIQKITYGKKDIYIKGQE